jgi:hypothetical protein
MTRFSYDRSADCFACSKCGTSTFRYKHDDQPCFGLKPLTSAGPIHIATPGVVPNTVLQADVVCVGCGEAYTPESRWDPAG